MILFLKILGLLAALAVGYYLAELAVLNTTSALILILAGMVGLLAVWPFVYSRDKTRGSNGKD